MFYEISRFSRYIGSDVLDGMTCCEMFYEIPHFVRNDVLRNDVLHLYIFTFAHLHIRTSSNLHILIAAHRFAGAN